MRSGRSATPKSRPKRWALGILGQLLVLAIPAGLGYVMYRTEQAERVQREQAERAETTARGTLFERGNLGEMLELCSKGWTNLGFSYQSPVALAWSRKGLFAYFHEGTDSSSLRQVRCEPAGSSRGPRFDHPLHAQIPAEAPTQTEQETTEGDWNRAVAAAQHPLEASELAVELLRHPVSGRVVARRWKAGTDGAVAAVEPADAPAFGSLLPAGQIGAVAASAPPALEPRPRHRWTAEPEAAFALLYREIPKGALISELTLQDDKIEVYIQHPTHAFDGKPDAPYGDKEFDEYGIADQDWWYPRSEIGFNCGRGTPLADVQAQFVAARANAGPRIASAWFSCSTAYSNGKTGVWHLVPIR